MRLVIISTILLLITFLSFCDYKTSYKSINLKVINKSEQKTDNGKIFYRMAFSNGFSREVDYGTYSLHEIGDTVTIKYGQNVTIIEKYNKKK